MAGRNQIMPLESIVGQGWGTAGTAVQLLDNNGVECSALIIRMGQTNSGSLYFGNEDVTASTGYPKYANEELEMAIAGTNRVYVVGSAAGQVYHWMALK